MRYTKAELLRSEISSVERFLEQTPKNALIQRLSWEERLKSLHERLAVAEKEPQPTPLTITFRGKPVDGTRSIDAGFGGDAVKKFVETASTVVASLIHDSLGERGKLPDTGDRNLRIVGTAIGSFGFDLELPPDNAQEPEQSELELYEKDDPHLRGVLLTLELLESAAEGKESDVIDRLAEGAARSAKKIHDFAEFLLKNDALVAVDFQNKALRIDRSDQLERIVETLKESNVSEHEEEREGMLLGILPDARDFELKLKDESVLKGKIDATLTDLITFKKQYEDKNANFSLRIVTVGKSTKYTLLGGSPLSEKKE